VSVLYAAALGLAALAVVPLVLHLRRRETSRRVAFPALRYLSRAEDASARSLRTRDFLLLAVRIGLVLALVGAAAGLLLGRGAARDHHPTDVALVIDNSGSTARLIGDVTVLDQLREVAVRTLEAMRPGDRVWIFPAVGAPVAAGVSGPTAIRSLTGIRQTDGLADLGETVARAAAVLPPAGERRAEIQLLSDLQRTAFAGAPRSPPPSGGAFPLVVYQADRLSEANPTVTSVQLSSGHTVPYGPVHRVQATVARQPGRGPAAVPSEADTLAAPGARTDSPFMAADTTDDAATVVRLDVDGRTAGAARVRWEGATTLRLPDLEPGPHFGRVEIEPGGLRADDARHFTVRVVEPPVVSFFGPANSFVETAVQTLRAGGRLPEDPQSTGVITARILEGAAGARARPAGDFLLLIPPADPVNLTVFNQLLDRLGAAWTLRTDPAPGQLGFASGWDAVPGLGDVQVQVRYRLEPVGGGGSDSVLVRTDDGRPWAVWRRDGGQSYLLLASPMVPSATGLPTSPAMIPFVEWALFRGLRGRSWPETAFVAGEAVRLPARADSVRGSDGLVVRVEGGAPFVPERAGVHELYGDGRAYFAVNVPAPESDLRGLEGGELEELFPGQAVITAGPGEAAWESAIFRARRGVDSAAWFLFAALILAVVEIALATPGRSSTQGMPVA
jgi:hypothetical protein